MATGQGIAECRKRHRDQEWLSFLRLIDRETPAGLDIHLICNSYATHRDAEVKTRIAKRKRFHLHSMPTYGFWLN